MRRRIAISLASVLTGSALIGLSIRSIERQSLAETCEPAVEAARKGVAESVAKARLDVVTEAEAPQADQLNADHGLALPSGKPASITCEDARGIVRQARSTLASDPPSIDAAKFAEGLIDWLDPNGLWSAAPDAPVAATVRRARERLLTELEAPAGSGPCSTAEALGKDLQAWSGELALIFDEGAQEGAGEASALRLSDAFGAASSIPFQEGPVTHTARELARRIGRDAGVARGVFGKSIGPYVEAARERTAPSFDAATWSRVVLAAAVRAYVPQIDAHGAWAPLEEELSIYDLALESSPPERIWSEMSRAVLGARIERGALPPLEDGDLVLRVRDVPLAGISVEQSEQLAVIAEARSGSPVRVTVLRKGAAGPKELVVAPAAKAAAVSTGTADLPIDFVRYGEGTVALITAADVPDDLGARLGDAIALAKQHQDLRGVMLDLRSNGGGSTDGAADALGLLIPGAALFPMRRRDGVIEMERAPEGAADRRYAGPLAVLVDGDTASAAEMIAGALGAYRRAVVVGDKTYGKGCAQEYLDDDTHMGVLRLTTLIFSLPDGSPVQKVGITPGVRLSLPSTGEREAHLIRALEPWRGPDVRDPALVREVPWPSPSGRLGPCADSVVCKALRAIGGPASVAQRDRERVRR